MTKLPIFTALAVTLVAGSLARAQDGPPGTVAPLMTRVPEGSPKSEDTALELSVAGTTASAVLILGGVSSHQDPMILAGLASSLVTPSLGQWYAGKWLTAGMGIRAASAAAVIVGFGEAFSCLGVDSGCHTPDSAPYLVVGGLAGYGIGTIYDLATARSAAREYNANHGLTMTVAPTPMRGANGQSTMGIGIGGSF